MKNTYRRIPFVRLLIPLMLGIFVASHISIQGLGWMTLALIPILGYLAWNKNAIAGSAKESSFGILSLVAIFFLGFFLSDYHQDAPLDTHPAFIHTDSTFVWKTRVITPPTDKNFINTTLQIESIRSKDEWIDADAKVIGRFKKDVTSLGLEYGDRIMISSRINPHQKTTNPHSFNYSRYLESQGIYFSSFIDKKDVLLLEKDQGNRILAWSYGLRNEGLKILKKHLYTSNEKAVGSALLLGYKDGMNRDVKNAYADTGATHVLAVSGLHVGILLMVIQFLFRVFKTKTPRIRWAEFFISVGMIWLFALVTGASPSVLRAATMFSFVALGTAWNKNKYIYNTLAASAFVLLCFDSSLLFNPGFQLSYLAVIGIVFFQPIIYRSWYVKNKFGNYIWTLISVSLAAQIATLPISLYYFDQFPTYFLISGLVVIPAAFLIMSVGLGLLVLGKIPFLGTALGFILYWSIFVMNSVIFFLGKMPFALIENINLSTSELILGYTAIIFLMFWIALQKNKYLTYALGTIALVCSSYSIRKVYNQSKQEMVFYDTKGTLIDYHNKGTLSTFSSEAIQAKDIDFAAKGNRTARQALHHLDSTFIRNDFLQIGNEKFYVLNRDYYGARSLLGVKVDGIIIQNDPWINFEELMQEFDFDYLIADGTNKKRNINKWREFIHQLDEYQDTPLHYTREGAVFVE